MGIPCIVSKSTPKKNNNCITMSSSLAAAAVVYNLGIYQKTAWISSILLPLSRTVHPSIIYPHSSFQTMHLRTLEEISLK